MRPKTTIRTRCPKKPIAVKARLTSRLISRVFESSRNFLGIPLYPWNRATPIRIAPTTTTITVPPGQSSTPAVVCFGLFDPTAAVCSGQDLHRAHAERRVREAAGYTSDALESVVVLPRCRDRSRREPNATWRSRRGRLPWRSAAPCRTAHGRSSGALNAGSSLCRPIRPRASGRGSRQCRTRPPARPARHAPATRTRAGGGTASPPRWALRTGPGRGLVVMASSPP